LAVTLPGTGIAGQHEPAKSESRETDDREGLPAGRRVDAEIFHRWTGALQRHRDAVLAADRLCAEVRAKRCVFWAWTDFLVRIKDSPAERQLDQVNSYVNRSAYVGDRDNWSKPDHWADPAEFFATGGDCEDFAIAKYFSLRALGFSPEQLRIVVVHDGKRHQAHTVLVVTGSNRSLLLDNRYDMVVPWSTASHYRPIYSINERSAWLHTPRPLT
jgi:predicted transglutaminase-like cysteine proteinase